MNMNPDSFSKGQDGNNTEALQEELRMLELEEAKLDQEIVKVDSAQKHELDQLNEFGVFRDKMIKDEQRFWSKFKEYERSTSNQQDEST